MVSSKGFQGLGLSSWVFRVRGYAVREFGVSDTGFLVICSGFRGRCARFLVWGFGRYGVAGSLFRVFEVRTFKSGVSRFGVLEVRGFWYGVFEVRGFGYGVFQVRGFGYWVSGSLSRVFEVRGLGYEVSGTGFAIQGLALSVWFSRFRVSVRGFGLVVSGTGFRG